MIRVKTLLDLLTYAVALLGPAPLLPWLDPSTCVVFAAGLCLGIWSDRRGRFPLKPAFASVLALAIFLFYALQAHQGDLLEPTVNLLIQLLAVRLLTPKEERHYLQIFALAVVALAGSSLVTLEIAFLAYLLLLLPALTAAMLLLGLHSQNPDLLLSPRDLRQIGHVVLGLPSAALGLMLFFFALLPRTEEPLWAALVPPPAVSGLKDTVTPGSFSRSGEENRVVFRVRMARQGADGLYWRALVFDRAEVAAWSRSPLLQENRIRLRGGTPVPQQFYLEPRGDTYLPVLDFPEEISGIPQQRTLGGVFTSSVAGRAAQYAAVSRAAGEPLEKDLARQRYLQIPTDVPLPLLRQGERIRAQASSVQERIARLEAFFRGQDLTYALEEPPTTAADPMVDFLFETRRGYCEHFASSFALLLRTAGVPARLVGGYYGGLYNELGGYYLVTENQAHVWVEALDEQGRWLRIDPVQFAARQERTAPSLEMGSLGRLLDAADLLWSQAIVGYHPAWAKEVFLAALGFFATLPERVDLDPSLLAGALAALPALGLFVLRRRKSREERLIHRFLRRMRGLRGEEISSSAGLAELAEEAGDGAAREFVRRYGRAFYRDRPLDSKEYRELCRLLRRIGSAGGMPPRR